jgi:hypothetical protein
VKSDLLVLHLRDAQARKDDATAEADWKRIAVLPITSAARATPTSARRRSSQRRI